MTQAPLKLRPPRDPERNNAGSREDLDVTGPDGKILAAHAAGRPLSLRGRVHALGAEHEEVSQALEPADAVTDVVRAGADPTQGQCCERRQRCPTRVSRLSIPCRSKVCARLRSRLACTRSSRGANSCASANRRRSANSLDAT